MNTKRWIALVVAAAVLGISLVINSAFAFLQYGFSESVDDLMGSTQTGLSEIVMEDGDFNNRVAVLNVDGVIQDTGAAASFFGTAGYNHSFFMEQLESIKEDASVKAVVLAVNSPGGGVVESAEIYDKIREIQEETEKPFYVSMGAIAASGGYYIAAPAEKIFVNEETLTGSIGVIMQSVNYGELAERYGVDFVTIKSGPYKDIMSPTRDMTEDERALLQEMLDDSYESFVDVIEEGRGMTEKEVKAVADGRIMNGRQAVEVNLADGFGFEEDVIEQVKTDFDLNNAQVFQYGTSQGWGSLLSMKVNSFFGNDLETQMISKLLTEYSSPRMMYLYGDK
ncbi:signal peptide peptidase [Planococcus sp. PAMC 21323]|uniref:signal peptide peptidase SppA n=1 Tax=Planococcus sp. PAMC 21323 TaxID=1526927 RepID=UPI00057116FE|nr:signal peptide peptidase SppA [Planococcus sp. PAMC 21323]AIY05047.1 signal peptide peptidase [Planococcus sp. PAMC 21323]